MGDRYAAERARNAALAGNAEKLQAALLELRQDAVSTRFASGESLLHGAARGGSVACVSLLLGVGANVVATDFKRRTPLHMARSTAVARQLLWLPDVNVDVGARSDPLIAAAIGDADALRSADPAALRRRDEAGYTALHFAALVGSCECVATLLRAGADLAAEGAGGVTALALALDHGHAECAALLVRATAEWEAIGCDEKEVRGHVALRAGEYLFKAAEANNLRLLKALIDVGASVNARSKTGTTVLHTAIRSGARLCAAELLCRGADMEARDDSGFTPLCVAAKVGTEACTLLLLRAGADSLVVNPRPKLRGARRARANRATELVWEWHSVVSLQTAMRGAAPSQPGSLLFLSFADSRLYDRHVWRVVARLVTDLV